MSDRDISTDKFKEVLTSYSVTSWTSHAHWNFKLGPYARNVIPDECYAYVTNFRTTDKSNGRARYLHSWLTRPKRLLAIVVESITVTLSIDNMLRNFIKFHVTQG